MHPLYVTCVWPYAWSVNQNFTWRYSSSAISLGLMLVFSTKWTPKGNNFETLGFLQVQVFLVVSRMQPWSFHHVSVQWKWLRPNSEVSMRQSAEIRPRNLEVSKVSVFSFLRLKIFVGFHFRKAQLFPCGFLRNGHWDVLMTAFPEKKFLSFFWYKNKIQNRIVIYLTIS